MMETRRERNALQPWVPIALLRPGQIFAGKYRIEALLGGGSSSQVHEAVDVQDGSKVAIKAFERQLLPSAGAVKRFEYAMGTARRVRGPHVASTLDAGVDSETQIPFIVTQLLRGETLESAVRRRGPMGSRKMLQCMRQIAVGLEAGHGHVDAAFPDRGPLVHGNLKPGSIFFERMVNGTPLVTILDFGLAEALERSRDTGARGRRGPPAYTAYEQICGFAVTPRTDIWAFALVAFFLLTGHHYWYAANGDDARRRRELFDEVLNRRLVPPSFRARELDVDVDLPPKFDDWFARCLEREPEQRFASTEEAFGELQDAFQREGGGVKLSLTLRLRWAAISLALGLAVLITLALTRRF
jgi:serine/threonine protein kinase